MDRHSKDGSDLGAESNVDPQHLGKLKKRPYTGLGYF